MKSNYCSPKLMGYWNTSDIARYLEVSWPSSKKETLRDDFPKPTRFRSTDWWLQKDIIKYYKKRGG